MEIPLSAENGEILENTSTAICRLVKHRLIGTIFMEMFIGVIANIPPIMLMGLMPITMKSKDVTTLTMTTVIITMGIIMIVITQSGMESSMKMKSSTISMEWPMNLLITTMI